MPEALTSWSPEGVFLVSKEGGRVASALGPGLPLAWTLSIQANKCPGFLLACGFLPLLPLLFYGTRKPELMPACALPSPAPGRGVWLSLLHSQVSRSWSSHSRSQGPGDNK